MKKYLKTALYFLGTLFLGSLLVTILNYFNIISSKTNTILLYIVSLISVAISSFYISKNLNKKGIITGSIYGLILIIIFFASSLIIGLNLNNESYILYIVMLIVSTLSGIIGKNKKND